MERKATKKTEEIPLRIKWRKEYSGLYFHSLPFTSKNQIGQTTDESTES
jgi:hypothetical protein